VARERVCDLAKRVLDRQSIVGNRDLLIRPRNRKISPQPAAIENRNVALIRFSGRVP
jgi:hypothetical protein